jgi:hypothetical protein
MQIIPGQFRDHVNHPKTIQEQYKLFQDSSRTNKLAQKHYTVEIVKKTLQYVNGLE